MDGKPIAFNDISSEDEHWLEKGEYDAWLSPCSPYKEFYLKRVKESTLKLLFLKRTGMETLRGQLFMLMTQPCQAESSFPFENLRKPGYSKNIGFSYFWKIFDVGLFSEFNHDPEKGSDSSLQIFLWIGF